MATYESIYQLSPATRMCLLSLMIWIPSLMESKSYQPLSKGKFLAMLFHRANCLSQFERIHTSGPYASQEVFALTLLVCLQKISSWHFSYTPKDRYPSMVNGSTRTQGSFGEKNTFMFIYIQNTYEIPFNETNSMFTPENRPPHLPNPQCFRFYSIPVSSQEGPSTETCFWPAHLQFLTSLARCHCAAFSLPWCWKNRCLCEFPNKIR